MVRPSIPSVRVVSGVDTHRPFGARVRGAGRALGPAWSAAQVVVSGFWPLWAAGLFALGLTWLFALSSSP
jgi:hypothetical protein